MPEVEAFNRYPLRYEEWFDRNHLVYLSEVRAVKELLPEKGRGVEIGVGSGRFAAPLNIDIGVEPSREMRKIALQKGIEVIDAVAEELPFEDEVFDFVLMITTICFLDDINKAFSEAYRVLKPAGCLIVGFIDKNSLTGEKYHKNKQKNIFYKDANFRSVDEVVCHLKKSRFKRLSFRQTIFNNLDEIKILEPVREGCGQGAFVVIKGLKYGKVKSCVSDTVL